MSTSSGISPLRRGEGSEPSEQVAPLQAADSYGVSTLRSAAPDTIPLSSVIDKFAKLLDLLPQRKYMEFSRAALKLPSCFKDPIFPKQDARMISRSLKNPQTQASTRLIMTCILGKLQFLTLNFEEFTQEIKTRETIDDKIAYCMQIAPAFVDAMKEYGLDLGPKLTYASGSSITLKSFCEQVSQAEDISVLVRSFQEDRTKLLSTWGFSAS